MRKTERDGARDRLERDIHVITYRETEREVGDRKRVR